MNQLWTKSEWRHEFPGGGGALDFQMVGVCRWGGGFETDPVLNRSAHQKYTLS